MAGSLSYAPRCDVEPLLDEVLTESSSATDLERPPAARRQRAHGYAAAVAAALVAGCLLAGTAKQFHGALLSKTMDATAFADASMGGTHKIVSKSSGKCLDWGQVIIGLTECDAANPKEMWKYTDSHLEAPNGQCLDMGGKEVHVWKCDMNAGDAIESNQHWKFDEETGAIRHHAKDNVCLAASGAGTKVTMETCDKGSHGQRWHVHVHTLPKSAEKEHDKQPTEQEAATEETLEHAGKKKRPAPAERAHPTPAAAPSMAPNGKAPEPREVASSAPRSEAAGSEAAAPHAADSALDWVVPAVLCCLLLAAAAAAFFVWTKRSADKQQSRAVKVEGDEKDVEAAEAVPVAEAADAEPAEQPGQQPEETPKPEEEASAETAGGSPAEEAAAGGDEEAAAQEAGDAEAAEAAEGGGGSPFEEAAAQEEAAEHAAEAGAPEDAPAPQEAGEAAAEAAGAAPAAAEAAGVPSETEAPAEATEAPAEAAGEAQPGEADEEDAALQEALRRSVEEQEQPPAQEEPQEQAAPEAAQAAPAEPEQPAPAPPKKSDKKCVVM